MDSLQRLVRTWRLATLLVPIGWKAFSFMRRAIKVILIFTVCILLSSLGAKRSFVAGVVVEFILWEQMARHCLLLLSCPPTQGGRGTRLTPLKPLQKPFLHLNPIRWPLFLKTLSMAVRSRLLLKASILLGPV